MPNRILRDWTDSENVDKLSFQAEVLFTRLFMKADDFGCYHANPKLVKSALFPLKDIREADISRWVAECHEAGLIALYAEGGKKYLIIKNFGQRLRAMKRKFPEPDSSPPSNDGHLSAEEKRNETEVESETKSKALNFLKVFNETLSAHSWIELVSMQQKKDVEYIKKKLGDFLKELQVKDDYHKGQKEIRSHFINWLKIQIEKETKKENGKPISKVDGYLKTGNDILAKRGINPADYIKQPDGN